MSGVRAWIFDGDPRRPWLAARTIRSLRAAGIHEIHTAPPEEGPVLIVRAGTWLTHPEWFMPLPENAPVAFGLPPFDAKDHPWHDLQAAHGGDIQAANGLPPVMCEWHPTLATATARIEERDIPPGTRLVHFPALDFASGNSLRALEIVTSLQHGGAEKIAADLTRHLPGHGVDTILAVLGTPLRRMLEDAPPFIDLSHARRHERAGEVKKLVLAHGIDVLHLHLTSAEDTRALSTLGLPTAVALHNTARGWPEDWHTLRKEDASLFIACSNAVAQESRYRLPEIPVRTVWNGIEPLQESPRPDGEAFTLVAVANPRPQKRLDRLPAMLAATRTELKRRGHSGALRLVIAGEAPESHPNAVACLEDLEIQAQLHGIRWEFTGGTRPVPEVLAEAHAFVSYSAHEGLSLAHLEALSAGLPVVVTAVGGTPEIAARCPAMKLIAPEATPEEFAAALVPVLLDPPASGRDRVFRDFSTDRMAARTARLLRQLACRREKPGETFWFVANNLSVGGAQSSLRRLMVELHRCGHRVRLALLQEYPDHPTPGREALVAAGIDVFVPPPFGQIDAIDSADLILAEMTADPPRTVTFWNAITASKFLIAEGLPFARVVDVSPGEMFFDSLDRWLLQRPASLPVCEPADYGRVLDVMVVKYHAEAERAAALGVPVKVVPNGIPLHEVPARRPAGPVLVFGTTARISPQKRLGDLLDAFRDAIPELPTCVLKIAGGIETGSEEHAAELKTRSADLPVEWLGDVRDIPTFHAGLDVFVMISNPAGCPNASLEALASGLPVIATDIGGASEQVIDGQTGRLVPPYEPEALAKAMVDLTRSPEERARLGANGRRHVEEHFSLERMTENWLKVLTHHIES
ncbi:glycosyltransferase family 4 protein [Luteolibacter ambystomatis]|uniref:Glycosyltransferase family 4 protein n=1 Tax=Luteolibacter ambystomatis TaxID=2824561 RepID=A0A975G6S1_9BACT|nr:glycosyltransferase family 4 protein [Luteolibacter ambystomatis]QUE49852.1 glycosyltransferase family 4 protein [Luteolibacter ambystomatis]